MSALRAAVTQADDARAYLIRQLDQLAAEIIRQQVTLREGLPYNGRQINRRMEAIDEARKILAALEHVVTSIQRHGVA